jgi:exosortase
VTAVTRAGPLPISQQWRTAAPIVGAAVAFAVLFWAPFWTLLRDWWSDPDAGHGLLLGPLSLWLAWRRGRAPGAAPQILLGAGILVAAVILRYVSGLAAELFTMRLSLLGGVAGLIVFWFGLRQLLHWWLPGLLLGLSVPLPAVVLGTLALPLQLKASQFGTALLEWRHVPVRLAGNVIHLPGQSLFVTEACSGLRSLTALLALGLLIGGLWLRSTPGRIFLVAAAIPVAMLLNGVRVFLTGFSVYYISPAFGEGVMHFSEGWAMFVIAFAMLGAVAAGTGLVERLAIARRRSS